MTPEQDDAFRLGWVPIGFVVIAGRAADFASIPDDMRDSLDGAWRMATPDGDRLAYVFTDNGMFKPGVYAAEEAPGVLLITAGYSFQAAVTAR